MRSRYGSSDVRSSYRTAGAKTTYLQLPAQLSGADQEPGKRFSSPLKRGRGMTPYEQRRMEAAFAGTCLAAVHANARSRGAGTRTAADPDQVGRGCLARRFRRQALSRCGQFVVDQHLWSRSEEHTSELQSLMRSSYAVFGLKKKNIY